MVIGHPPFETNAIHREALRLQGTRFREWLAWHHFRSGRGIVNDSCHNRCGLHQVSRLGVVIEVHVGVMRTRSIFKAILDELESGYSDRIE